MILGAGGGRVISFFYAQKDSCAKRNSLDDERELPELHIIDSQP